ncbi:hypothetical protein CGRA01v4_06954 [Colletotrichum graminicola]|nr:hypothetical protein CGRA01v4_06954 [Colletotrichum graminicola]
MASMFHSWTRAMSLIIIVTADQCISSPLPNMICRPSPRPSLFFPSRRLPFHYLSHCRLLFAREPQRPPRYFPSPSERYHHRVRVGCAFDTLLFLPSFPSPSPSYSIIAA